MKKGKAFPKPLRTGAYVGLIAPASPITKAECQRCVDFLEQLGYTVVLGETLKKGENLYGYLAGSAHERARDVNRMFLDEKVEAIFCVRGGYGSVQLLEYLDYEEIAKNPKIFVGYSDVTCLHTALGKYCDFVTYHGPMVQSDLLVRKNVSVGDTAYAMKRLYDVCNMKKKLVFRNAPGEELEIVCTGRYGEQIVEGRLFGGNLSVLARLLGTPFSPVGGGSILFLEDVGESIPRIHMYLTQMKYAGMFEEVNGILLGDFTECGNEKYDNDLKVGEFLQEWFGELKIPVLGNVCSDHRIPMGTLPMGAWCRMDTFHGGIVFEGDTIQVRNEMSEIGQEKE